MWSLSTKFINIVLTFTIFYNFKVKRDNDPKQRFGCSAWSVLRNTPFWPASQLVQAFCKVFQVYMGDLCPFFLQKVSSSVAFLGRLACTALWALSRFSMMSRLGFCEGLPRTEQSASASTHLANHRNRNSYQESSCMLLRALRNTWAVSSRWNDKDSKAVQFNSIFFVCFVRKWQYASLHLQFIT